MQSDRRIILLQLTLGHLVVQDHYYDELDREDAAREERQRQSAGHVDL